MNYRSFVSYWIFAAAAALPLMGAQVAPELEIGVLPSLFVHGDHFSVRVYYQMNAAKSALDIIYLLLF